MVFHRKIDCYNLSARVGHFIFTTQIGIQTIKTKTQLG